MSQYIKLLAVLKFYSRIVLRKLVVSELEKFRKVERLVKNVSEIKIVQNNISDNFYFDVNNVQPKLKEVIFYFFFKQW